MNMSGVTGLPLQFATGSPENPTDAELAEACKRGNMHAFECLYELHTRRMKSLAFHLLGSRADAEDAVQEAFIKVHRRSAAVVPNYLDVSNSFRLLLRCDPPAATFGGGPRPSPVPIGEQTAIEYSHQLREVLI
jgi:hypothetical protein